MIFMKQSAFRCSKIDSYISAEDWGSIPIPVATYLNVITGDNSSTVNCSAMVANECNIFSEMTIINGCPVSNYVWRLKKEALASGP